MEKEKLTLSQVDQLLRSGTPVKEIADRVEQSPTRFYKWLEDHGARVNTLRFLVMIEDGSTIGVNPDDIGIAAKTIPFHPRRKTEQDKN